MGRFPRLLRSTAFRDRIVGSLPDTGDPFMTDSVRVASRPRVPAPLAALSMVLVGAVGLGAAPPSNVDLPRYPSLSPDGSTVAFSWRGDLWKAPATGGLAVRLTSHPDLEGRSAWSPDGRLIVFESERDGFRNLFAMSAEGGEARQITRLDAAQSLVDFGAGPEGKPVVTFDASIEGDLFRSQRPYRIGLEGGQPQRVHDAFGTAATYDRRGQRVLFERGGASWQRRGYLGPDARDVWLFDGSAGSYRRLTDWAGNDGMPRWLSDDEFMFLSDRGPDGKPSAINLFRQKVAPGSIAEQITRFEDDDIHGWSLAADGKRAIVAAWDTLYLVDLATPRSEPRALAFTAHADVLADRARRSIAKDATEAALSPDGQSVALVAYGDVWVRGTADKSPPRRVTDGRGREREIAWSPDGLTLYFASDRDGGLGLYAATVERTREELRKRTEERLAPPKPAPEPAPEPAAEAAPSDDPGDEPAKVEQAKEEPKRGERKKDDKPKDPRLDPARWADAILFSVAPIGAGSGDDSRPVPSPDGRSIAFKRGAGDVAILELDTGAVRTLAPGFDQSVEFRWSPDSRLLAYAMNDRNFNSDIWLVPADGSEAAKNITRHPDSDRSPRFSADGKILAFLSERTNEEYDVWIVNLDKDLDALVGKDLDQYFKDAAEAVKKRKPIAPRPAKGADPAEPVEEQAKADADADANRAAPSSPFADLELDDAYLRVRRVTTLRGNESSLELLPAGDKVVFTGSEGRESSLYAIKSDGTGLQRLGASGDVQGLSFNGDRIVLVAGGVAQSSAAGGGDVKTYDVNETIDIDLAVQNERKFRDMARIIGSTFYHPTMKGLDWPALTDRYLGLATRARVDDEFDWVANRMLGELNASHLGVRSPERASTVRRPQGRLGVRTKPVDGGFEVLEVVPRSPAAMAKRPLEVGDVITAIDFEPFGLGDTVEGHLAGKVGKESVVSVRRARVEGEPLALDLLVVPVSAGAMANIHYDANTAALARAVDEWSNGALGYIHIRGMNQPSLDDFERDLYAAAEGRKGLLIDVRNNGGGSTADLLLASIMVQPHAYTIPRGGDPNWRDGYPQDRLFIQRYTLPVNMLCNEKSFSNAEIVSHAFKTLKRGTLVGQQTAGGVISTGGTTLVDGTTVRLPFRGWYLLDGTDMENNGAMPDLVVPQTPEEESAGLDAQLRAAVEDLLRRIG